LGLASMCLTATAPSRAGPVHLGPTSRIPTGTDQVDEVKAGRDMSDRMTVPVMVNGQGPFPFVIDTGADRTVISAELAAQLGLKPGEPVILNDTGGVGVIPKLGVGARELHDVSAPMLMASNLGAMGLLGIDSLRDQRMVMDFHARRMTVEASKPEHFGTDVIVVQAHRRLGQLVLVDAAIGGEPIMVILDSGAQNSIGNFALRDLLAHELDGQGLPVEVISVAGHTTPARFAVMPRIRVGGISMHNVPIAFADLHTFSEFDLNDQPAILLGMDVLRHFDRVAVDFGRKEVSFRFPDG
jgi:predicted aspartyl protease